MSAAAQANPIDFENSEGNLGLANARMAHMAPSCQGPNSCVGGCTEESKQGALRRASRIL